MTTINVFWTPEEAAIWLGRVAEKYDLKLLVHPWTQPRVPFWRLPPFKPSELANSHLFLAPASSRVVVNDFSDIKSSDRGWVVVRGGSRNDQPFPMLAETEVILHKRVGVPRILEKCIVWLKRQLQTHPDFSRGIRGWSVLGGASRPYKGVFYSGAANEERKRGRAWVQWPDPGNARFGPLDDGA